MRIRTSAVAVILATSVVACGRDDAPSGPGGGGTGLTVSAAASNVFSPSTLNVTVGATVTWVFGPVDHNVVFNMVTGAPENIGNTRNSSVSRTFNAVGTFPYTCTLHSGMNGTVVVRAGTSSIPIY